VELSAETMEEILTGRRPSRAELSGATLDGKNLPERRQIVPWDLSGANLRGTVLTRLDLSRAKFAGADLGGAAFRNVNLSRADFRDASAAGAIFEDVNLAYSDFREADLRGASFSYVNLADVSFKEADLRGASVNGVRFSLNGGTHTLGLKEALRHRYEELSYPLVAGISGDAFWLSYLTDSGKLMWGGFPRETFRRGLVGCGFDSSFVNEVDVKTAWKRLIDELGEGNGVITPLHVGEQWITGSGFGGSEWVYVSGGNAKEKAVQVRCILGDDLAFTWDDFVRNWCRPHPQETRAEETVYTLCVVGDRVNAVPVGEAVLLGIREGLEILHQGEFPVEGAVCGVPVYDLLLRDLQCEPSVLDEGCAWLGLGLMHHHGSRWAIRDFLVEARPHLAGADEHLDRAIARYDGVLDDLRRAIGILPAYLTGEGAEGEAARESFLLHRDEAGKLLRSARSGENHASDALERLVETARPK